MIDVSQLKVLVADDHFLARQIVTDVMREMGITNVTAVVDGESARNALLAGHEKGYYDVAFLDRNMPHLEGLELLKQFRARPEYNKVAFVMFTSSSEQSDVINAIKAGATGYLIKPVAKLAIQKKMKEIILWLEKQSKD